MGTFKDTHVTYLILSCSLWEYGMMRDLTQYITLSIIHDSFQCIILIITTNAYTCIKRLHVNDGLCAKQDTFNIPCIRFIGTQKTNRTRNISDMFDWHSDFFPKTENKELHGAHSGWRQIGVLVWDFEGRIKRRSSSYCFVLFCFWLFSGSPGNRVASFYSVLFFFSFGFSSVLVFVLMTRGNWGRPHSSVPTHFSLGVEGGCCGNSILIPVSWYQNQSSVS